MEKPTPAALREAVPISQSYASMILADGIGPNARTPPRNLAIKIFRATGWRHPSIEALTEDQMAVIDAVDPWEPKPAQAQDAA